MKAFEGRWGYRSTRHLCYVEAASASLLLHSQEGMHGSKEFTHLAGEFFRWFRTVQEWASAWSGEPLMDFDATHNPAIHIPDGNKYLTGSPAIGRTIFIGARPLSQAQLSGALRRASQGEHLPVEHRMLLSAADARLGGDTRKAVIDAATAAEVALASYIADQLRDRGLQSEFIDEMIKDVNGLANLNVLCTRMGGKPGVSKGKLDKELANVRNRAAHRGRHQAEAKQTPQAITLRPSSDRFGPSLKCEYPGPGYLSL